MADSCWLSRARSRGRRESDSQAFFHPNFVHSCSPPPQPPAMLLLVFPFFLLQPVRTCPRAAHECCPASQGAHEQQSIAMALAAAARSRTAPHGARATRVRKVEEHVTNDALRRQEAPPPGARPGVLLEPWPQTSDRSLRHSSWDCRGSPRLLWRARQAKLWISPRPAPRCRRERACLALEWHKKLRILPRGSSWSSSTAGSSLPVAAQLLGNPHIFLRAPA